MGWKINEEFGIWLAYPMTRLGKVLCGSASPHSFPDKN